MRPNHLSCPSCGAEHRILDPNTVSLVCEYCDNVLILNEEAIQLSGKQSKLVEGFSRLYRGAIGEISGNRFQVLGRVRYSFGSGFWDEWYLMMEDGSCSWLTEDNQEFSLQRVVEGEQFSHHSNYSLGEEFTVEGLQYRIQEIGMANCLGIEGSLPKAILPNENYPYIDGSSLDGVGSIGLEYDNESSAPTVFIGRWLNPSEILLDDEELQW